MYKARIRVDGLACLVFRPEERGFDKTAVVASGIPYVTDEEPITPILNELGYGVIQPQYIGTFDSDGRFTPEGCIETLLRVQAMLERHSELFDLRGETRFKVGRSVDVVAGHSFGTYVAIGAVLRGLPARVALAFSPMFEFGAKRAEVGLKVDLEKHVRHMSEALPLTLRMKSSKIWRQFFLTRNEYHPSPNRAKCAQRTKLFCAVGDSDPSIDAEVSAQYVRAFAAEYAECLELVDYRIIPGATHDVKTMLTPELRESLRKLLSESV
jgi:hypothetical protein